MKKLLVLLLLSFFCLSFVDSEKKETKKTTVEYVYICNGPSSKKYHKTENCRGLTNCSTKKEKIDKNSAIKKGRTACKICYK